MFWAPALSEPAEPGSALRQIYAAKKSIYFRPSYGPCAAARRRADRDETRRQAMEGLPALWRKVATPGRIGALKFK